MDRREIVLAAMAPAKGERFTPVQVQKLFFLIDMKLAKDVDGPFFNFRPYHYGPFDASVYEEIGNLAAQNLARVEEPATFSMKTFYLTAAGQDRGDALLKAMSPRARDFVERTSNFVRTTPFAELVSAIYKAYPQMRARSIFRERR